MSNMVTIKQGDFFYRVPEHEYLRYWSEHCENIAELTNPVNEEDRLITAKIKLSKIPYACLMAATKRGKAYKRDYKEMTRKGSGRHATTVYR